MASRSAPPDSSATRPAQEAERRVSPCECAKLAAYSIRFITLEIREALWSSSSASDAPAAAASLGVSTVEGPVFPVGLGLLSMIAALCLLGVWPTVVMLIATVLVMVAASGVIMLWLVRLMSDESTDAAVKAAEREASARSAPRAKKRPIAVGLEH
jgi:hypothetical protein